ncbi:MAG: hypothetical protein DCC88_02025 [Spirobacillus cienkowskii]|uniref:Type II/III secretion system secretin-like domain-containing protein n=1 Tax=Spirobacillus cienkowskii TaxID=495820 RepID=A0A369KTX7_9BACT|nr:MAG: hypothetical protein DCC88_02025 [Spirobacillus cienkowskii]
MAVLYINKSKAKIGFFNFLYKKISQLENESAIDLVVIRGMAAAQVGLLNHTNLSYNSGILYKNKKIFHTFGMNFSICVVSFDKKKKLMSKPCLILPNSIFIAPRGSCYVAEIHESHCKNEFFLNVQLKKNASFSIIKSKLLSIVFKMRFLISLLSMILLVLIANSSFASENLKLITGKEKIVDLGSAPQSIIISDPEYLQVQRIGLTNSVKFIPQREGKVDVQILYPDGVQSVWHIVIAKEFEIYDYDLDNFDIALQPSANSLHHFYTSLKKISGIVPQIKGGKIIILGRIKLFSDFRKLVNIVAPRPQLFFPLYTISQDIEPLILKSIENDIKLLGDKHIKIINRGGLYCFTGISNSMTSKNRSWQYVSALLPNVVNAIQDTTGASESVQINLHFLEVGKLNRIEAGLQQPGMRNPVKGTLNFSPSTLASSVHSTFQIAPMEMLLKAIQQRSFSRNIAQPVVITRSGEKATFLAGGEVPIVAAASTTTNTNQNTTVTYKPFGILFNVTPLLQNDGSIWLKLELEVSDVSEYLSFQNVPGFVSRKINTNIILKDNNYALLSGLVQSKNSKNVDRSPILSNIPIIGEIFKSRRFKDDDSELWIAVSAMRSDQQNDDIDIKKFIEKKAFHYQNLLTGSLLD